MQAWPFAKKIQVTQTKLLEWYYYYTGRAYISFSGGKDSTVLADLAARVCKATNYPLNLVFANTGLEYPEIQKFVTYFKNWLEDTYSIPVNLKIVYPSMSFREVLKTYGYPVISKETARCIYYAKKGSQWAINKLQGFFRNGEISLCYQATKKYAYLVDAPFPISDYCCTVIKKWPLEKYQKKMGLKPIVATMATESRIRRNAYLKSGCNSFQNEKSQPMSFWTEQDILQYLSDYQIPYCPLYGDIILEKKRLKTTGLTRTGCIYCMFGAHLEKEPNRFQILKHTHPKQYQYCIETLGLQKVLEFIHVKYE